MLQKIISVCTVIALLMSIGIDKMFASGLQPGERYFITTAYYSPLPNQKYYNMGSYEAEKKMNGEGIRGASGRKVYGGMLAAPGKYAFGTKIQLEGIGIGSVEDRGGAIVAAGQRNFKYDRIDVWVGYGDEGLRRAMFWGKKVVKGTILPPSTPSYINIWKLYAPKWVSVRTKKNPYYIDPQKKISTPKKISTTHQFFNYGIGTQSKKNNIVSLQKFLKEIDFYTGPTDGIYNNNLMQKIYDFQKQNNIVTNWKDIHAGYWSYNTRALLWKKYNAGEFKKKKLLTTKDTATSSKTKISKTHDEKKIGKTKKVGDIYSRKILDSEDIQELQKELKSLNLYKGKITGEYNDIQTVILNYQLDMKLISSTSDIGAGNYGPKTREALKNRKNKLQKKRAEKKSTTTDIEARVKKLKGIKEGDVSGEVRELQKILLELGYFNQKDTAIFGKKTRQALINYQIETKVISDTSIYGAGIFGPKTQAQIITDLMKL